MKKLLVIIFCAFFITATTAKNIKSSISTNISGLKNQLMGPSLVPSNDPRLIAIIIASLFAAGLGGYLVYDSLADSKEGKPKSSLRRLLAFVFGNVLISGSFIELFFARTSLSVFDQFTQEYMQQIHKEFNK